MCPPSWLLWLFDCRRCRCSCACCCRCCSGKAKSSESSNELKRKAESKTDRGTTTIQVQAGALQTGAGQSAPNSVMSSPQFSSLRGTPTLPDHLSLNPNAPTVTSSALHSPDTSSSPGAFHSPGTASSPGTANSLGTSSSPGTASSTTTTGLTSTVTVVSKTSPQLPIIPPLHFPKRAAEQRVIKKQSVLVVDHVKQHQEDVIGHLRQLGISKERAVYIDFIGNANFYDKRSLAKQFDVIFLNVEGMVADNVESHIKSIKSLASFHQKTFSLILMCEFKEDFEAIESEVRASQEYEKTIELYRLTKPCTLRDIYYVFRDMRFTDLPRIIQDSRAEQAKTTLSEENKSEKKASI